MGNRRANYIIIIITMAIIILYGSPSFSVSYDLKAWGSPSTFFPPEEIVVVGPDDFDYNPWSDGGSGGGPVDHGGGGGRWEIPDDPQTSCGHGEAYQPGVGCIGATVINECSEPGTVYVEGQGCVAENQWPWPPESSQQNPCAMPGAQWDPLTQSCHTETRTCPDGPSDLALGICATACAAGAVADPLVAVGCPAATYVCADALTPCKYTPAWSPPADRPAEVISE